jgi:hypothetical protein
LDRAELTLAVAAVLVAAVLLGWALGAIAARLNARAPAEGPRLAAAEDGRRAAEARLAEVEADLRQRLAEAEHELRDALAMLDRERAQTEELRAAYRAARGGAAE